MKMRKGFRKIVVKDKTWQWFKGRVNIVAYSEDNEKRIIKIHQLLGMSESTLKQIKAEIRQLTKEQYLFCNGELEDMQQEITITPQIIAKWLEE